MICQESHFYKWLILSALYQYHNIRIQVPTSRYRYWYFFQISYNQIVHHWIDIDECMVIHVDLVQIELG
jgi:hypothetical protein